MNASDLQMQEYRRLLYVAMTRAADRLYVCGFAKQKADEAKDHWYNLILQGTTPLHVQAAAAGEEVVVADYGRAVDVVPLSDPLCKAGGEEKTAPSWLFAPPPPEPSPPRPLVPSRPSEEEPPSVSVQDARFARGRIIHRLLQNLPDLPEDQRKSAALRFLANPQHGLPKKEQTALYEEVTGLLADQRFAPLFGADSRAEQPIVGLSGERLIAGQVDRLALVEDEVWIVDYKTNRPPPEKPEQIAPAYRKQMDAYRTVLRAVYPDRKVRCFLLWTYALSLMEC
jgi:ATP-dependent helicase/nuclease subunit A